VYTFSETPLEAWQKMRDYFSQPGAKIATNEDGDCLYMTEKGNKCAVGCLVDNKDYNPVWDLEGDILALQSGFLCGWDHASTFTFMHSAQIRHDKSKLASQFVGWLDKNKPA